jgi:uncharacterized SAM-binding protein YcdF (DUF218 family)
MKSKKQKQKKKKSVGRIIFNIFITITAIVIVIGIYIFANAISIKLYSEKDERQKADAIIVLGASSWNGKVTPVFKERINHGIYLYNEGYAKKIIFTGGYGKGSNTSDAKAAEIYAKNNGVPETDILCEEESTVTLDNLKFSKEIMDENNLKSAIIVSDPLHMKRAMLCAKDAGIDAYSSPTGTSKYQSREQKKKFLERETFCYIAYKFYRIFF